MSERPAHLLEEMRQTGDRIKTLETQVKESGVQPGGGAAEAAKSAPAGRARRRGRDRQPGDPHLGRAVGLGFEPQAHWDLGERLGIIDLPRGAKVSGSRFFTLTGQGAKLQRALISWMLDLHVQEHGYQEVYVPYMVRTGGDAGKRQPAQVRGQPLPRRRGRPVAHPHGGGPPDRPAPGRGAGARRPSLYYVAHSPVLPPGEGGRRQGHQGHQARPPVRQGGALQADLPGDLRRRA